MSYYLKTHPTSFCFSRLPESIKTPRVPAARHGREESFFLQEVDQMFAKSARDAVVCEKIKFFDEKEVFCEFSAYLND